jgi:Holliday junction resolvase-like predicted endonuclease
VEAGRDRKREGGVLDLLSHDALARVRAGAHAAVRLEREGLAVVDAAYATRWGTVDLVAATNGTVVFCQVGVQAPPTLPDAQTLHSMATIWLADHAASASQIRFDAITVGLDARGGLRWLDHAEDVG